MASNASLAIFIAIDRMPDQHLFLALTMTVNTTIALFHDTGAIEHSHERIAKLWSQTQESIEAMGLTAAQSQSLRKACERFLPDFTAER